jgi:hypothetical protein
MTTRVSKLDLARRRNMGSSSPNVQILYTQAHDWTLGPAVGSRLFGAQCVFHAFYQAECSYLPFFAPLPV